MCRYLGLLSIAFVLLLGGCPPERFPDSLPPLQDDVNSVISGDGTAQEKREALEDLGLTPLVINALLVNEETGNQYGGDLRTAYDKIVGDRFTDLTPDEIQIYANAAEDVDESLDVAVTDAEAQAILDLFAAEDIDSANELNTYLLEPANEVPGDIPNDVLQQLFVDFNPASVVDSLP